MTNVLQKIEEKHDRVVKMCARHESPTLGNPHVTVNASALRELADDILKLARALNEIMQSCSSGSHEYQVAKRALEEVK